MSDWNPGQYLSFADERTRPARDLLAQVPLTRVRRAYDLGCGPGNSTALLLERFPEAAITAIDTSPAMLDAARKACPEASFEAGDLTRWMPEDVPDLLFSNAAFQWVPDHLSVLERLGAALPAGGVLAVQMPDNLAEPSHRLMQAAAEQGQTPRVPLPAPEDYYARLKPLFRRLDVWHTVYNHPLQGVDAIVDWLRTTGLKPYLDPLQPAAREAFLTRYKALLREAYPEQPDGKVLLRFPRLFILGVR